MEAQWTAMRLWPTKGGADSLAPGSTACLAEADARGIVVLTVVGEAKERRLLLQLWLSGSRSHRARKKRVTAGAEGGMGVFEEKISDGSKGADE